VVSVFSQFTESDVRHRKRGPVKLACKAGVSKCRNRRYRHFDFIDQRKPMGCQTDRLSRLPLNSEVDAFNADIAVAVVALDAADAANAVDASPLPPLPGPLDGGGPGGGFITMAWVIALLAPLIALILEILIGESSILPRAGLKAHRQHEGKRLTNP
jgi:hypothetical protein